ncbi:hypothetical protein D3C83_262270 [compost metagenome]
MPSNFAKAMRISPISTWKAKSPYGSNGRRPVDAPVGETPGARIVECGNSVIGGFTV